MNDGLIVVLRDNLGFLKALFANEDFFKQLITWLIVDGFVFFLVVVSIITPSYLKLRKGIGVLNRAMIDDVDLSPSELYGRSIEIVAESPLIDSIIAKWISIQKRLTSLQRSDFISHIENHTPSVHVTVFAIARFFLLGGLFFTFASLSSTFLEFRGVEPEAHITFVQSVLIPNVGTALTSTLVAIIFSIGTIGIATSMQSYTKKFCLIFEEFLIERVSPQHELQNAERNLGTLIEAQKDMSELVTGTIKELRNVADITNTAYSDLSDATHKFVQAFDSTQQVIKHVDTNQEQIVEQNKKILLAATALQDSVLGIQRVFELENSAIGEVNQAIKGTNIAIDSNADQVKSITVKFDEYNSKLSKALADSTVSLENMNLGLSTLSESHDQNRNQVTQYISLLNKNSTSLGQVMGELSLIVEDAKIVEKNISGEADKISDATGNMEVIGNSAKAMTDVGERLETVTNRLKIIADSSSDAYQSFSKDITSAEGLIKKQINISADLENISSTSQRISQVSTEARNTQNELSSNTQRLGQISDGFAKTYGKYINRLDNLSYNPGYLERIKKIFRK
jgi:ABC-type transporter Mla subunit MlaD